MNNKTESSGGIGFLGLLTIVFIVLKLVGVINWSWIWVLSPIWIPIAIALLILISVIIIVGISSALEGKEDKDDG